MPVALVVPRHLNCSPHFLQGRRSMWMPGTMSCGCEGIPFRGESFGQGLIPEEAQCEERVAAALGKHDCHCSSQILPRVQPAGVVAKQRATILQLSGEYGMRTPELRRWHSFCSHTRGPVAENLNRSSHKRAVQLRQTYGADEGKGRRLGAILFGFENRIQEGLKYKRRRERFSGQQ